LGFKNPPDLEEHQAQLSYVAKINIDCLSYPQKVNLPKVKSTVTDRVIFRTLGLDQNFNGYCTK